MVPPVSRGFQHPPRVAELLAPWQQLACALFGLFAALAVFWFGYGALTDVLSGLGMLSGTGIIVLFFAFWGLAWALTEHLACQRRRG